MKDKFFNLFNDNPTLITNCPVCGVRYSPIEARILEDKDNAHLVYIKCRQCQAAILALMIANNLGVGSIGLVTDLTIEDILRFRETQPISYDDVIELHQFLNREKALINYLD